MAKFPLGTRRSGIRLGTTWRWAFWFTLTQPVRSVRVRRFQTPRRICGVQGRVRTGFPGARTGEPTCSTYLSETGVCSRKTRVGQRRVRVGRWSCRVSIRILPLRGFENGASGRVRIVPLSICRGPVCALGRSPEVGGTDRPGGSVFSPKYLSGAGVSSRNKKLSEAGVSPMEKKKLSLERTTCLADKTNHPVERLSLNRSQCGSCSTKYDTPTSI